MTRPKRIVFLALILLMIFTLAFTGCQRGSSSEGAATSTVRMIPGANVPRNETLILENPGGRSPNPQYFNRWSGWNVSFMGGLQQLALDTLWYVDPNAGINGPWENSLASDLPIYNSDFTELTIKLRQGIYWSDGVQFTADDVIFTIETMMKHDGMYRTPTFRTYVRRLEKINDFELKVYLTQPNSRFHMNFTVRWDATFIMPKHIWEKIDDPASHNGYPLVSLGPYTLKDFDPQGYWYLWEKRPDWQRTTLGQLGSMENSPKYAMYIDGGTSDTKVMSMRNRDLDVIHDVTAEGIMTLRRSHPTSKTWFPDFPWGHPDPTLVAVVLNTEKPGLNNKDVRWGMTLSLDMVRMAIASTRGAITMSAIHVPPTGMHPQDYFQPMEGWLTNFTLDLGDGTTTRPYNPNIPLQVAEEARKSLGDQVPTNPADIKRFLGAGWWNYDVASAEKLMIKGGMRRNSSTRMWEFANGQPFRIELLAHTEGENPGLNRMAPMIIECWREFGIDATLNVTTDRGSYTDSGEFDAILFWNIESLGGHPDLSTFLTPFHSSEYVPIGQINAGRNWGRWRDPRLDRNIEELLNTAMESPRVIELGKEYIMLSVEEMHQIPISSYNVLCIMDEYYWTGYPDINNPYTDPVANWSNTRYMYLKLRPTGRN